MKMSAAACALFFLAAGSSVGSSVHPDLTVSHAKAVPVSPAAEKHTTAKVVAHKPKVASLVSQKAVVVRKVVTIGDARSELLAAHKAQKVWCGGMFADGCAACPQGNGESWCHGECVWSGGQCGAKTAPTTTSEMPRPAEAPTTTASARPEEPTVAAVPAVPKVLAQHSAESAATAVSATPESSGAAPPGASLHSVKFTPPATMKLDPQWAAHLATAPLAAHQATAQAVAPQETSVPDAASEAAKPTVSFDFAVPQAVAPAAATTQAPVEAAAAPRPTVSESQPFATWGISAAPSVGQAASAAVQAFAPKNVVPESAPQPAAPEMVKQTVRFTPPAASPEPERMVHNAAVTPAPSSGHFLAGTKKEEECACAFHGDCTCESSMAFMECISSSCAEGCECHDTQYHDACEQLSDACSPVGLSFTCDKERAVCLDNNKAAAATPSTPSPAFQRSVTYGVKPLPEIQPPSAADAITAVYHSLNELKEDKCALELASSQGFVNADNHLTGVMLQVSDDMGKLAAQCLKMPEMHCEKDFEEWSFPPPPCGEDEKKESSMFEGVPTVPNAGGNSAAAVSIVTLGVAALAAGLAGGC